MSTGPAAIAIAGGRCYTVDAGAGSFSACDLTVWKHAVGSPPAAAALTGARSSAACFTGRQRTCHKVHTLPRLLERSSRTTHRMANCSRRIQRSGRRRTRHRLRRGIAGSFGAWQILQTVPEGPSITDARNPLARLQLPIAERHFKAMNELLPVEVWLN